MTTFYKLAQFGFLSVSGIDSVSFMQGYTTCNLETLTPGKVQMGAVCNLQGRMLNSFLVIRQEQDLLFRMHHTQVEPTIQFLSKYIVFSKAKLHDLTEKLVCYGSLGADNAGTMKETEAGYGKEISLGNRKEFWIDADTSIAAQDDPAPFVDAEIEAGIAWVDSVSSEQYLPQMFNYHAMAAIDFDKGCYLGQEIVARAQYRGELKRKLHCLPATVPIGDIEGGAIIATGSSASLAVLSNSTIEPIEINIAGQTLTATPLQ